MMRSFIWCMIKQVKIKTNDANRLHSRPATLDQQNKIGFGNRMMSYSEKLQQPEWKVKRKQILRRDGFKCRNCSSTASLQIHHKQYHILRISQIRKDPWNYESKYLITLCNKCHGFGHKQYKVPTFLI